MLIALAVAIAVAGFFIAAAAIGYDRIRGVIVATTICAQFVGWSLVVPLPIRNAVVVGSIVLLLLAAVAARPSGRRMTALLPITIALFATTMVTTSLTNPDGVAFIGRVGSFSVLLVIVVSQFSDADVKVFRHGFLMTALIQCGCGLIEFSVTHAPVLWGYRIYPDGRALYNENVLLGGTVARVQGTTSHPVLFAVLVLCALMVLLHYWRDYPLTISGPAACALALCLVLSGTRMAIVAGCLAILVLAMSSQALSARARHLAVLGAVTALGVLNGDFITSALGTLVDSGSYSNRVGNIGFVPRLLARSPLDVLFGSGGGTEPSLFDSGLLFQNGFDVVDNQLVTSLATEGIVGVILLVALFVYGARQGAPITRAILVIMFVMLFSFDYVRLTSMLGILLTFAALPRQTTSSTRPSATAATGASIATPPIHRLERSLS